MSAARIVYIGDKAGSHVAVGKCRRGEVCVEIRPAEPVQMLRLELKGSMRTNQLDRGNQAHRVAKPAAQEQLAATILQSRFQPGANRTRGVVVPAWCGWCEERRLTDQRGYPWADGGERAKTSRPQARHPRPELG